MKRRITAWLAGATLMIATSIGVAIPAARAYDPGNEYAQQALARDYAWMGYYQKHHNWAAYRAEQAKIAQEEHHLHKIRHFEHHHDYSYHHDYPPGWAH
ncbi:MAG: hypothetical protein ACLQU2_22845 [Candidatus Binataceae bacterium]